MKAHLSLRQALSFALMLALFGFAAAGCKSTPKIDWNTRVGSFTYDQAVAEMGPPDKSAKLSDGSTVAEWITRRRGGVSFGLGTGGYVGSGVGVGVGQTYTPSRSDKVLRLTFGPDNVLKNVVKNY